MILTWNLLDPGEIPHLGSFWGCGGGMQSLASLAVERHAWTRASLHGACAAQPLSGFNMPGVEWRRYGFCTSPRLEMSGNLRL